MESQRLGDYIVCNPTVKLKKGQQCQLTDIDSITIGQKYPISKGLVIYDGQSGSKFSKGDTIMARITPCLENGKIAMYNGEEDSIGSTELFVFRGKEGVSTNEFVYYFFKQDWIRNYAANSMTGASGRQRADIKFIQKAKVQFPPLATQQKISSILSAYDTQIENNQKRIKLLEQMAENLYKEWFVRFRFPGYENVEFEGGIPKGWTRCKLGDLIDFQNGFAFKSETFVPEGKYKVITIKNVQDGQFDSSNADRVEDIPKGMPSYCKLSEGDILLSLTGNVGRVCHAIGDNMLLNQRVAKIKSSHSHFAYCMLRTPAMFAYLNMIAYGTAQLNLSPIKAANLKIIKPTESIMEAFDKVVAPLFSSVFNLYNQIDFLSSQRDLLLPRLMSGKLSI